MLIGIPAKLMRTIRSRGFEFQAGNFLGFHPRMVKMEPLFLLRVSPNEGHGSGDPYLLEDLFIFNVISWKNFKIVFFRRIYIFTTAIESNKAMGFYANRSMYSNLRSTLHLHSFALFLSIALRKIFSQNIYQSERPLWERLRPK